MYENSCTSVAASVKRRVRKLFARGGQGRACELSVHGAACASSTLVYEVRVMESYVFRATVTTACEIRTDAAASEQRSKQRRRHAPTQNIVLE